jgi:hypothetical protein
MQTRLLTRTLAAARAAAAAHAAVDLARADLARAERRAAAADEALRCAVADETRDLSPTSLTLE